MSNYLLESRKYRKHIDHRFSSSIRQAYSMLAQSVKPATDSNLSAAVPALSLVKSESLSIPLSTLFTAEREDYPLVKFWFRHEWNAAENSQVVHIGAQGKARAAQGENVSLKFIENEDGNIIDGFRATAIRRFARELWAGLNGIGKAPKTWGKVDAAVAAQYRNEMERRFPELHLGDNHWKADLVATLNYPSWYNNNIEKEEHSKRVSVDSLPEAKRHRTSTDAPPLLHTSKKRTKHCTRNAVVEGDSQLSIVRLLTCYNAIFICSLRRTSRRWQVPRHPKMQITLPCVVIHQSAIY